MATVVKELFNMQNIGQGELLNAEEPTNRPNGRGRLWKRKELWTLLATFCFSMLIGAVLISKLVTFSNDKGLLAAMDLKKSSKICMDKKCVEAASAMLADMDTTAQPCDDFYQFSCGGRTALPGSDAFTEDNLNLQLRELLSETPSIEDPEPIRNVKTYYQLCTNESRIEEDGPRPILQLLKKVGGWPLMEDDWDDSWSLQDTVYKLRELGFDADYLLKVDVKKHPDLNTPCIFVEPPSITSWLKELFSPIGHRYIDQYLEDMIRVAVILGADPGKAYWELTDSLQLEVEIIEALAPTPQEQDLTFGMLKEQYPEIRWDEYAERVLLTDYNITDDERVIVTDQYYLETYAHVLQSKPKRMTANYLMSRVVQESLPFLPRIFSDLVRDLLLDKSRSMECIKRTCERFPLAVPFGYIRRFLDPEAKQLALDLFHRLKEEISDGVQKLEWLDEKTRRKALDRLDSLVPNVDYPDELADGKAVIDYHKELDIRPDSTFLEADLALKKFRRGKLASWLGEKRNVTAWHEVDRDILSFHDIHTTDDNEIVIKPPLLQIISTNVTSYRNYAMIGKNFGYAIIEKLYSVVEPSYIYRDHDDLTRDEVKMYFETKELCFNQQYGNYSEKHADMKGSGVKPYRRSVGQKNIADSCGLKYAYRAYLDWVEGRVEEPKLPGMKQYTPRQLFWISFASMYCSTESHDFFTDLWDRDYPPNEFRVLGPLYNLPEFAMDFDCPPGSKMNPIEKCDLW